MSSFNPNRPAPSYTLEQKLQYLANFGYLDEKEAAMIELAFRIRKLEKSRMNIKLETFQGEIRCEIKFTKRMDE